ncbi:restriction endonuclease subunit S [Anaerovibrio lipolyticus]|uniref:restriction endonuclease subunit S n=1 Tax=Anaerovibrio lipolyticus TaxID=82374 RepID=UPI00048A3B8C|nr:restriction endonuclease subunit S [Anaerovibrio lipolyticus]
MAKLIDITGKALSGEWGTDDEKGIGIPVLRTTNFTNEGVVDYTDVITRIITKKNLDEKYLKPGDIIIEKSGGSDKQPVGRVIYFDGPEKKYLFNNFTGLLRVKEPNRWFPKYVFYSLFGNYRRGGTRPFENKTTGLHNLKTDDYVSRYEVKEAKYSKQIEISEYLDKLYSIIKMREKELVELDTLIKARFVEMFGDIAIGKYKYETRKLGEVADVGSSHRVFTSEFVEEGIPFYRGTEIGVLANGQKPSDPYYITMEHYKRLASDGTKPKIGDLLMPSICDKGQVWMVDSDEPFYYKDGRVLCISADRNMYDTRYLQYFMKVKTEVEYPKIGSGSTFAEFKIFLLKDFDVLTPPRELQRKFSSFVNQVNKSKFVVQKVLDSA